ncbi:MAG: rhomboid family intramembrane serine protease [Actinocatenispora sp.]
MTEQQTGSPPVPVCYRHTGRETYVRCTRCSRPICPDCMNEASVGFQCPECVNAGARTVRSARTAFGGGLHGGRGVVTISLIAANVLVYVLILVGGGAAAAIGRGNSFVAGAVTQLEIQLGVLPAAVAGGEYWRLVTAMFVHFSILHLAMNMWVLWVLGRYLERSLGPGRFLALYVISGIGGNVAVYLFGSGLAGGASTAVFGLFAAMFFVNRRLGLSSSSVIVLIVINLAFTFLVPNISILGHLGGLVTGAVAGIGLAYAPRQHRSLVQFGVLGGILLVLILLTVARTASLTT